MKKINVYLDMDGTIYDLYNQPNWLERLQSGDETVFSADAPLTTEQKLFSIFPKEKYEIKILSMTPKNASDDYCAKVIEAKNAWLDKYFPSLTNRIYKKYGNNKNFKNSFHAILVDDSEPIRESFHGWAINPADLWG